MKTIPLSKGMIAIVDDDDFEWLSRFKWHSVRNIATNKFAAGRTMYLGKQPNGKYGTASILMHREILGVTDRKVEVDHINGATLDNRRENLRACTKSQNQWNRGKPKNNSTGYKGVSQRKGKFLARIMVNGKDHCLGSFPTREEAAKVYVDYAALLHQEFLHKPTVERILQ